MIKIFPIFFVAVLLTGCCTTKPVTPPIVIATTPPVIPPASDVFVPSPVQWKVYNSAELKTLAENGQTTVLFTLDTDSFKNLSNNLIDIKKIIKQQNEIIEYLTKAANMSSAAATNGKPVLSEKK